MAKTKPTPKKAKKPAVKAKKPVKPAAKPALKAKKPVKKPAAIVTGKSAGKLAAKAPAKAGVKTAPKITPSSSKLATKPSGKAPILPDEVMKGKKEPKGKAAAKTVEVAIVDDKKAEEAEIVLTDAEGRRYCRVQDCDQIAIVEAYCRYHYLLYWKKIQYRKKILADNKFFKYIDELTAKYPDKFLDVIRKDLMSQKNFSAAIQEMEIDESADEADVDDKSYMDDMRGIGAEVGTTEESNEDF